MEFFFKSADLEQVPVKLIAISDFNLFNIMILYGSFAEMVGLDYIVLGVLQSQIKPYYLNAILFSYIGSIVY